MASGASRDPATSTRGRACILRYHAIEAGAAPIFLPPHEFERQLDLLVDAEVTTMRLPDLADAVRAGAVPDRTVALTFDHACRSAVTTAVPLLAERGLTATFFPVWAEVATGRAGAPSLPEVATAADLAELAAAGFEIGSHGLDHRSVHTADADVLRRELLESKQMLEQATSAPVESFALPFGSTPSPAARALLGGLYETACSDTPGYVDAESHPLALRRFDASLLRSRLLLRAALAGRLSSLAHVCAFGRRAHTLVRNRTWGSSV